MPDDLRPGDPADERPAGPSLSPSRAADFKTCPLLFRFRTIDRLPERTTPDQIRGTLVHAVLEHLFDLPAAERTPEAAAALVAPEWARLVEREPTLAALFTEIPSTDSALPGPAPTTQDTPGPGLPEPGPPGPPGVAGAGIPQLGLPVPDIARASLSQAGIAGAGLAQAGTAGTGLPQAGSAGAGIAGVAVAGVAEQPVLDGMPGDEGARLAAFLQGAGALLEGYFAVEDPRRLEPAEREALVSTLVADELLIRGYIDRLDVSPAGELRVVDYKTGGAPREAFEGRALFQLKFYALVLWRTRGVVPKVLRLLYLKDAEVCDYSPDAEELERFERTLLALSEAIERAKRDRDFRPKPSRLCGWCSHQAFCPEFGGTIPPYPEPRPTEPETTIEGAPPPGADPLG